MAQCALPWSAASFFLSHLKCWSGSVPPSSDSGKLESGFHKDPFSNYTQSNDYSWDASKTSFTAHDKVTLYRDGVLLWGLPPSG